jgi:NAD(P)-dependent dehydrogenase (short-subunit alcohol dehydrogenase family)
VLAGIDLSGKLAVVTGGYSGIGIEDVRAFSAAGAAVVVPARRPDQARAALSGVERVEVHELDLANPDSVRAFSERFLRSDRPIDVLVNNAGIMANPETRVGAGWESQFATNHLGHFALTNRLWPALADGARVISVSSRLHKASPIQWDDLQFERGYDKWQAYGQSKTANVLLAVELDRLAESAGVRAFAVYPERSGRHCSGTSAPRRRPTASTSTEIRSRAGRRRSRAPPRRRGVRRLRSSRGREASTSRIATWLRSRIPTPRKDDEAASTPGRSTRTRQDACGLCLRSSQVSMRSRVLPPRYRVRGLPRTPRR